MNSCYPEENFFWSKFSRNVNNNRTGCKKTSHLSNLLFPEENFICICLNLDTSSNVLLLSLQWWLAIEIRNDIINSYQTTFQIFFLRKRFRSSSAQFYCYCSCWLKVLKCVFILSLRNVNIRAPHSVFFLCFLLTVVVPLCKCHMQWILRMLLKKKSWSIE